jgi:hypothetical protein
LLAGQDLRLEQRFREVRDFLPDWRTRDKCLGVFEDESLIGIVYVGLRI